MLRLPGLAIIAAAAITLGAAAAQNSAAIAAPKGGPPNPSATGMAQRSPTAAHKGANDPRFCPPGQKRKPGKGSAFHC
jgi:hypothetical protein